MYCGRFDWEKKAVANLTFEWTPEQSGRYEILANATIVPNEVDTADNKFKITIYVGYTSSSSASQNSESINGYHVASLVIALFGSVICISSRRSRETSISEIPASAIKQYLQNNSQNATNIWQDNVRQHLC